MKDKTTGAVIGATAILALAATGTATAAENAGKIGAVADPTVRRILSPASRTPDP